MTGGDVSITSDQWQPLCRDHIHLTSGPREKASFRTLILRLNSIFEITWYAMDSHKERFITPFVIIWNDFDNWTYIAPKFLQHRRLRHIQLSLEMAFFRTLIFWLLSLKMDEEEEWWVWWRRRGRYLIWGESSLVSMVMRGLVKAHGASINTFWSGLHRLNLRSFFAIYQNASRSSF